MEFQTGSAFSGPYEFGYEEGWHWSKNGGSYNSGREFFWVHWEISDDKPNDVKLHIESPKSDVTPELNKIKQEMVEQFLSIQFKSLVERNGFVYVTGSRVSPHWMENNKSTQAFRVVLSNEQRQGNHQANIKMINALVGEAMQETIQRFTVRLNQHFEL